MNADSTKSGQPASLKDYLLGLPQYLYPQHLISACTYKLTRLRTPWLKNLLIRLFIKHFDVQMHEAAVPNPSAYLDFNHFFTRSLRTGARPLTLDPDTLCCPVDGIVSQAGNIDQDTLLQAKGRSFSLTQLLGGNKTRAQPFQNGSFATLYLSPRDYHRIHMPIKGVLQEMVHIPGRLFSVSPLTTRVIPGLFARNERLVALFATAAGPMAMVLVGAINVSSIATVWAGTITPPYGKTVRHWTYPPTGADAVTLEQGDELGRFNMGSTVIILFVQDAVRWHPAIHSGAGIRMGQNLAVASR